MGFSVGCQKELKSTWEGLGLSRASPLGLTSPQPKRCPPHDSHCLWDSPKSVFNFCNYFLIQNWLVTVGSLLKGPCGWWPHATFRWQIAEQALSREKTPGPEPHGKMGCFLCVSCLYPSGEETARLWQGAFKTHKTVNCYITGWYLEEEKKPNNLEKLEMNNQIRREASFFFFPCFIYIYSYAYMGNMCKHEKKWKHGTNPGRCVFGSWCRKGRMLYTINSG